MIDFTFSKLCNWYFLSLKNSTLFLKSLNALIKQFVMSSRPGNVIDCCSDKAICTTTVKFIKCHKITYGLVARLYMSYQNKIDTKLKSLNSSFYWVVTQFCHMLLGWYRMILLHFCETCRMASTCCERVQVKSGHGI